VSLCAISQLNCSEKHHQAYAPNCSWLMAPPRSSNQLERWRPTLSTWYTPSLLSRTNFSGYITTGWHCLFILSRWMDAKITSTHCFFSRNWSKFFLFGKCIIAIVKYTWTKSAYLVGLLLVGWDAVSRNAVKQSDQYHNETSRIQKRRTMYLHSHWQRLNARPAYTITVW